MYKNKADVCREEKSLQLSIETTPRVTQTLKDKAQVVATHQHSLSVRSKQNHPSPGENPPPGKEHRQVICKDGEPTAYH